MSNQVFSARYATAQSGTTIIDAATVQVIHLYGISLSVPAGQNAQLSVGGAQVASTEGSLNLVNIANRGPKGGDMTVTSSGAVSISVVYQFATV